MPKSQSTRIKPTFIALLAAGLILAGCGPQPAETAPDAPALLGEGDAITITANDQMKYNLAEIRAEAGAKITLTLQNIGKMPKAAMGHNWVLLKADADAAAFVQAAMTEAANDYLPAALEDQIIVHTKMLGGGETDTITFTVPAEPGSYPFICSFPAHFQVGMKGVLLVE